MSTDAIGPARALPLGSSSLDALYPELALPVLALEPNDIVALVAQQIELVGHRPTLQPENLAEAERYAELLLALLGAPPPPIRKDAL